ncbi:hypothetical protein AVEN_34688-1 [Araneus ventricosus]|uniref:Uncharacterized protein n=1 Tax=Araneus ventricosus TaxID=182803 RepID=A0A4Y2AZM0_ARAVE|nr:hypothetical protein AVEN_34688-1 [Araneus ventricosus]
MYTKFLNYGTSTTVSLASHTGIEQRDLTTSHFVSEVKDFEECSKNVILPISGAADDNLSSFRNGPDFWCNTATCGIGKPAWVCH